MTQFLRAAAIALALLLGVSQAAGLSAQTQEIPPQLIALEKGLQPRQGKVAITEANATLDLGTKYDFYGPVDARTILIDLWGNPPGNEQGVLGIVMPAGASPLSDSWGAVISYEDTGYVADDDAAEADYGEILEQLKQGSEEANAERTRQGYPAMHVVGWAENPHYDAATHSVVWARDLKVDGIAGNALNYDLRTLGRKGVLSINFISGMSNLADIRLAAASFADHARFEAGSRYEDFDPATDRKAEYGIGGLVAAGVGVAAAKKLGILAILLKFGKFIVVGLLALGAVLRNKIAGLFGFGRDEGEEYYADDSGYDPGLPGDLSGVPDDQPGRDPPA